MLLHRLQHPATYSDRCVSDLEPCLCKEPALLAALRCCSRPRPRHCSAVSRLMALRLPLAPAVAVLRVLVPRHLPLPHPLHPTRLRLRLGRVLQALGPSAVPSLQISVRVQGQPQLLLQVLVQARVQPIPLLHLACEPLVRRRVHRQVQRQVQVRARRQQPAPMDCLHRAACLCNPLRRVIAAVRRALLQACRLCKGRTQVRAQAASPLSQALEYHLELLQVHQSRLYPPSQRRFGREEARLNQLDHSHRALLPQQLLPPPLQRMRTTCTRSRCSPSAAGWALCRPHQAAQGRCYRLFHKAAASCLLLR